MFATPIDPSSVDGLLVEIYQMRTALASRTITSQATGLLASQFGMPTERAWSLLREISNMSNRKLLDIARIVVDIHNDVPISPEDTAVALALAAVLGLSDFRCNEVRRFQLVVLGVSRPSNAMSKAFRAAFHRITHRALPRPVGSRDRVTR